jgi:hypothetical protein
MVISSFRVTPNGSREFARSRSKYICLRDLYPVFAPLFGQ